MFIRNINIISFLSSLSLSLSVSASCDQESTVFTCDLENKGGSLKACFNQAENSMYFVVDENGLKTVYTPRQGKSLDNYKWIDISFEEPEFIPLKFEVNENKNAYFSLTRGGGRLSVVANSVDMIEDENAVEYYCELETETALDPNVRLKIKHVKPNEFEAWG
ncbi:hypothetical protein R7M92_04010 [Vibrio sp. Vb2880]|uniref:hypothetical protein n=1 Tax=Vibrio TaxID=662 RepID=UPI001CDD3D0A|nr:MULTISPECIES: hypothetical protein [Vibrio]MCA2467426.1 hypothetical protein [Vibrio alginolyticus]MCR9961949.1 hypothetical protein [Vibrio alginolyticus]MDW1574920.1 hypothetical protein [Vibrio sp. Vb2880]MDW2103096.1 hypothetical protein [Vibrio sp. 1580]MDW2196309.1 hypothetical protein [Vibrio sp. 2084]